MEIIFQSQSRLTKLLCHMLETQGLVIWFKNLSIEQTQSTSFMLHAASMSFCALTKTRIAYLMRVGSSSAGLLMQYHVAGWATW